jgi:HSP20 family protein
MKTALDFFRPRNLFGWTKDLFDFNDDFFKISDRFTNSPKVNVKETDKAFEIEIANPGFTKDETKIEVKDGMLCVSMTSESKEGENDGEKYHCKQWTKSSFQESWYLPENVIEEQITAKNVDGVLTVTLPKKEVEDKKVESRTIEIE